MRLKFTILLLLLNIGVFAWIYYLENPSSADDALRSEGLLVDGDALSLEKIIIEGRTAEEGTVRRVLERRQESWVLVEPIRWPANPHAVQRILNELQFLEGETRFSVAEIESRGRSLADYGLEEPLLTLTLVSESGEETVLRIGDPTEMANRLYVLSPDGEEVIVVSNELGESLSVDLSSLRNPQVFDIPIFEIGALTVQIQGTENDTSMGQQRVRIDKEGREDWQITAPVTAPADVDRVERLLSQLTNVKADSFNLQPTLEMGLDNPRMRVTLWGNKRSQTLFLGAQDAEGNIYARLDQPEAENSPVFTVPPAPFLLLRDAQVDLRQRAFMQFDPANIHSIRVERPGGPTVALQRLENDAWQVVGRTDTADSPPAPHEADVAMIEELLLGLRELEAVRFVTDAPSQQDIKDFGLEEPQYKATLGNGEELTLLVGKRNPDTAHSYAKLAGNPSVYEVRPRVILLLNPKPLDYRDKTLYSLPAVAKVQRVRMVDLVTNETVIDQSIDPQTQTWEDAMAGSDLPEEKREALLALIPLLKELEVHSYLQPGFTDDFKLYGQAPVQWRYRLDAEVWLPGGDEAAIREERLFISSRLAGAAIGNAQIAGSPSMDMIFSLTQPMIDALFPLTFSKPLPEEPAEKQTEEEETLQTPEE